ncbi:MAG: glycosyltransferase family 39 protein [Elusimicrobiota bacterium]
MTGRRGAGLLLAIAATALFLRWTGIDYGLPQVFNSDEPHHVSVAVSFGRGSLDPGVFKYPTLWMYVLFAAYGVYFLLWSGLGLLHSAREFGELFVRDPAGFYLLARALAAALSLAAVYAVYRAGEKRIGLWAGALLAVSPTLIVSAHAAKPESLMLLWSALAFGCALRYLTGGRERMLWLCGAGVGLAVSTQYNAAPLAALVPAAWWARRIAGGKSARRPGAKEWAELARAAAWIPAAFLLGSPYVLLNWSAFYRDALDHMMLNALGRPAGGIVLYNAARFAGQAAVGAVLLLAGAWHLARHDRPRAVVLLVPTACVLLGIGLAPEGYWERYLLAAYPALALIAAYGVEAAAARVKRIPLDDRAVRAVVAAGLMLPGALQSHAHNRALLLPDTRTLSTQWVEHHIPPGASVLIDQDHASPRLGYSRAQAEELLETTRAAGHPRAAYYRLMVSGHPGGGYRVQQILRDYADLHSGGWHTSWSAQGRSMIDVRPGLQAARAAGVEYVVLTSFGARLDRSPELVSFLRETELRGTLLKEFRGIPGVTSGPRIRIYRI